MYYFYCMGYAYKITNQQGLYYLTFTVKDWIDIFTRNEYRSIITNSLNFCIKEKGLEVYAWVLMSNHLHTILSSSKNDLSSIIRDFKKFTSTQIIDAIEQNEKESRKRWLLWLFKQKKDGEEDKKQLWQPDNHPEEIRTEKFYKQKMQYIHQNPVRAGWVRNEEDYEWSSAGYFYKRSTAVTLSFYNG